MIKTDAPEDAIEKARRYAYAVINYIDDGCEGELSGELRGEDPDKILNMSDLSIFDIIQNYLEDLGYEFNEVETETYELDY